MRVFLPCLFPILTFSGSLKSCFASAGVQTDGPGNAITLESSSEQEQKSPFWIVIDGGSTGSRLHIFEFVENDVSDSISGSHQEEKDPISCVRRGSYKVNKPLSGFARSADQIADHVPLESSSLAAYLLPLFDFAAGIIPQKFHSTTEVRYEATAGMRLVDEDEQNAVYDTVYEGLIKSVMESSGMKFPFTSLKRSDIGTLSGELEGFYGAVAANYLSGAIDVRLKLKKNLSNVHDDHSDMPLGALDMGGSSTQLVFLSPKSHNITESCIAEENPDSDSLKGDDFFSTSYLSYGVDQFRERLWDTWISDREAFDQESTSSCINEVIPNPCTFKGFSMKWKGYTLYGTGDALKCSKQVRRLIPSLDGSLHHDHDHHDHKHLFGKKVGGVEHPPLRGKFYAMSLYFFTLDSLRVLSHPIQDAYEALNLSWPNPSIQELYDALHGMCGRSWQGDLEDIQHDAHEYTRAEVLPHRCIEAVYMVTLLRDGFGFHPSSRDITFTHHIDGSEVEWALGMVLSLFSETQSDKDTSEESSNQWTKNNTENCKKYGDGSAAKNCFEN